MHEIKDTGRALVRIGFDGLVHKTFRGPLAKERFENEVRVLRFLEEKGCDFGRKLLSADEGQMKIVTTNCGGRVDHLNSERMKALYAELEPFGVRQRGPGTAQRHLSDKRRAVLVLSTSNSRRF